MDAEMPRTGFDGWLTDGDGPTDGDVAAEVGHAAAHQAFGQILEMPSGIVGQHL